MNFDTLRRLSGVSFASALRIVLAFSYLSSLVQARPPMGRGSHHNSEEFSSESGEGEEASHDLIVKLLLDLVNVLPSNKLAELDVLLSRGAQMQKARASNTEAELEMPQADDPGAVPEDTVDVEEQTIVKDLPVTSDGEVVALDDMNTTAPTNIATLDYPETAKLPKMRERDKDMHLKSIKNRILGFFQTTGRKPGNWSDANPEQKAMLKEVLKTMTHHIAPDQSSATAAAVEEAPEKVQSFYPSCSMPSDTDEDLWSGGKVMNLVFNVSYPPPAPSPAAINGTATLVTGAKLRLYFKPSVNSSMMLSENCSQTANDDQKAIKFCSVRIGENGVADDKQFRVSVYRYTKPLNKRQKMKRKLLDSRMMTIGSETWAEMDVKGAVKAWGKSKNFGLAVQVEDLAETTLPADRYFVTMNCSKEARAAKPIPGFVLDATREMTSNVTWGPELFPTLDLTTSEMTEEQQRKLSLEEALKNLNSSSISALQSQGLIGAAHKRSDPSSSATSGSSGFLGSGVGIRMSSLYEQEKHKIRHHNKRKLIDGAIESTAEPPKLIQFPRLSAAS